MSLTAEEKRATNLPYDPPEHITGQIVRWWETGSRSGRFHMAVVFAPGERMCKLQLLTGERIDAVAHIDDPKLKNPFVRDKGAWEHTEHTVEVRREKNVLVRRIRALEEALIYSSTASRDVLIVRAKAIGVTGASKMKTDELKHAVIKRMEELRDGLDGIVDESKLLDEDAEGEPEPPLHESAQFNPEPETVGA